MALADGAREERARVGAGEVRVQERHAAVAGLGGGAQGAGPGVDAVAADDQVGLDRLPAGELDAVPAARQRRDRLDGGAPGEGAGGYRVEQHRAQRDPVHLRPGFGPVVRLDREQQVGLGVQHPHLLPCRPGQRGELAFQAHLAHRAQPAVLTEVEAAALGAGVPVGVPLEDPCGQPVPRQQPGDREAAGPAADDHDPGLAQLGHGAGGTGSHLLSFSRSESISKVTHLPVGRKVFLLT